jgi:hypothetical protein
VQTRGSEARSSVSRDVSTLDIVMTTHTEACELVKRFMRLEGHNVVIHKSTERNTHWLINYGLPSIEDPSRIFMYVTVIVEKESGCLYYAPSRSPASINWHDFPANRHLFVEVTPERWKNLRGKSRHAGNTNSHAT